MIILDTNVISELMRASPEPAVVTWAAAHPVTGLWTTALTQAEVLHGVLLLPRGKRRDALAEAADAMFREDFAGRVLAFGGDAARSYADIVVKRKKAGTPISQFDAQIAGIARSVGATVATRNTRDFVGCGIDLVDPWSA